MHVQQTCDTWYVVHHGNNIRHNSYHPPSLPSQDWKTHKSHLARDSENMPLFAGILRNMVWWPSYVFFHQIQSNPGQVNNSNKHLLYCTATIHTKLVEICVHNIMYYAMSIGYQCKHMMSGCADMHVHTWLSNAHAQRTIPAFCYLLREVCKRNAAKSKSQINLSP